MTRRTLWIRSGALLTAAVAACLGRPLQSTGWLAATAILASLAAPWLMTVDRRQRWFARGWLIPVDLLTLVLAPVAGGFSSTTLAVGLCGLAFIPMALGTTRRAALGGAAWFVALSVVLLRGWDASAGVDLTSPVTALLLLTAWAHFNALGRGVPEPAHEPAQGVTAGNELFTLLEITEASTGRLDVGQVMHAIVDRVGELVDTPSCSILLTDQQAPSGFVMASKGHPEAEMLALDLAKYPEVRRALETRAPVVVDDVATDSLVSGARGVLMAQGFRSLLVLPLQFGQEVLGVLFLKSGRPRAFPPSTQRFCRVVASISANALKNAMLYRDVAREAVRHRETGEKLRRVLDASPDLIIATDAAGRVTEVNREGLALSGWPMERWLGRPLQDLLAIDGEKAARAGAEFDQQTTLVTPDERRIELSLRSAVLRDADGEPVGRVWLGRDVTELRRVEQSLIQAERLSSLGEVVAGVAHELNNPLSGVVGYAELLRAHANDPAQIRDLERIVESAMRCQKIVFKLLSFARKHPPEKRYGDVNDCVHKVIDLKSYHLRSSQLQLTLELAEALPKTSFDAHQIEQVMLNLFNNAEQAVTSFKRSGRIVVRTGVEGEQVWFEVEDDGPGVRAADRDRIFDPFFTTKELGQGTGLGLAVSYGIVRQHGGSIELRPSSGEGGACFRFSLPIVHEPEPAEVAPQIDDAVVERLRGCRVLVAEDEPVVLELFARVLTEAGAAVTLARDGEEAWELLHDQSFDLVVTDLRMPRLGGRELYERAVEERPEMLRRFVFATGDLVRQETVEFLEGLPNRILTKPLQLETVRRVLSQALSHAA